jgi:extradiol dioxygenase family protein
MCIESLGMDTLRPFHIAFPVQDVEQARMFYGDILGCPEGRSAETWVDFNLFGHQVVAHCKPAQEGDFDKLHRNPVDGHDVPVPHFGVILKMDDWKALRDRLVDAGVRFEIEPHIRFEGEVGEQATMFFLDPFGNALEFKAFADLSGLFAK